MSKFIDKMKEVYEKKYKLLMLIPLALILFSVGIIAHTKITTGEFIQKDVSLKGGILITIQTDQQFDLESLGKSLESSLGSTVQVRPLKSVGTGGTIGYTIETESRVTKEATLDAIRSATSLTLESGSYTIEEVSSSLGSSFWQSTIKAILLAFLFMSLVVIFQFRTFIPSLMVISCAAADILIALGMMTLLGIKLSGAGVAAILMIIGYSVDTDILLTAQVLRTSKDRSIMEKIYSAIKTGLTCQITTTAALLAIYILSPSSTMKMIALIIMMGVFADIICTWLQNVGMLRWYVERGESRSGK